MLKITRINGFVAAAVMAIVAMPVFSQTAKLATNCQTSAGKDGYKIQNECYAADITLLDLSGSTKNPSDFSDLGLLMGFRELTFLDVSNTQVSDLLPLSGLVKLRLLYTPDGKKHNTREKVVAAMMENTDRAKALEEELDAIKKSIRALSKP